MGKIKQQFNRCRRVLFSNLKAPLKKASIRLSFYWRTKRSRNAAIAIFILFLASLLFQNCQQRSGISLSSSGAVPVVVGPTSAAQTIVIPTIPPATFISQFSFASSTPTPPPLKILFIVDDSNSMAQTQQQLQQGISGMISALQGSNASLYVATTSASDSAHGTSLPLQTFSSVNTYIQNGITYPSLSSINQNAVWSQQRIDLFQEKIYGFRSLTLSNAAAALGVGTSGYEISSGFMQLARATTTTSTSQPSIFNLGDTALVVLVSDSDDKTFDVLSANTGYDFSPWLWDGDMSFDPLGNFYGNGQQKNLGFGKTQRIIDSNNSLYSEESWVTVNDGMME